MDYIQSELVNPISAARHCYAISASLHREPSLIQNSQAGLPVLTSQKKMKLLDKILGRKKRSLFYERSAYTFDGNVLIADDPEKGKKEIELTEVEEIGIQTLPTGPFAEDVFWVINRGKENMWIPQESKIFSELLEVFQKYQGFKNEKVIKAMSCTDDCYFACWTERSEPVATGQRR